MKPFSKTLLTLYLIFLAWLVLFKTSTDFSSVLADHQSRSLNLIPFAGYATSAKEMIDNLVVFIPLGLLLGMNFRQTAFGRKLALICLFSVVAETAQYVLAIGRTDITDVIMNTIGGLIGLALYGGVSKWVGARRLDWFIVVMLTSLLMLFFMLRFLVLKVRY